jgi:hypothetical protein
LRAGGADGALGGGICWGLLLEWGKKDVLLSGGKRTFYCLNLKAVEVEVAVDTC